MEQIIRSTNNLIFKLISTGTQLKERICKGYSAHGMNDINRADIKLICFRIYEDYLQVKKLHEEDLINKEQYREYLIKLINLIDSDYLVDSISLHEKEICQEYQQQREPVI